MPSGFVPDPSSATSARVVIRISPMAHFATGFVALSLLALVPAFPAWAMALLVIPVVLSVAIVRLRTMADRETVTARTLLGSRTLRWDDIDGLRFAKSAWARARLTDGSLIEQTAL